MVATTMVMGVDVAEAVINPFEDLAIHPTLAACRVVVGLDRQVVDHHAIRCAVGITTLPLLRTPHRRNDEIKIGPPQI